MTKYRVIIDCPIERVGSMLYDITQSRVSSYMVYSNYWGLLRAMLDYPSPQYSNIESWFVDAKAYREFADMCEDIQSSIVSRFSAVTGELCLEREDSDTEVYLADVVNPETVKPHYIDRILPWTRKNLKYISSYVSEAIASKHHLDADSVDCYINDSTMDWGCTFKFEIHVPTQEAARDLNVAKAKFGKLDVIE